MLYLDFYVIFVQRQWLLVRRSPHVSLNARTIKDELHVYTHRRCHKEFEALPEHTNLGNSLTSGDKWLTSSDYAHSLITRTSSRRSTRMQGTE